MCHNPAVLFQIEERGYVKEGFYADLVLVDLEKSWKVNKDNILYKCGWSPFNGYKFKGTPVATIVNGEIKMKDGKILGDPKGQPIVFK